MTRRSPPPDGPTMTSTALRRLPLALATVAAGMATAWWLLPETAAWAHGRTLIPLVFVLTLLMEWVADLDTEEGLLHLLFGKLQEIWESSGAGFYGALAAATFVRLEIVTFREEWAAAGSLQEYVRSEFWETVLGFSLESLMNLLQAAVWFLSWLEFPAVHMAALAAGCFAAYAAARWAWPDPEDRDALESALERITRTG